MRVCGQAFLCLDGSCGMPVETVDARAGNTGNTGNAKKMVGRHEIPVGLHVAVVMGRQSAEPPKKVA